MKPTIQSSHQMTTRSKNKPQKRQLEDSERKISMKPKRVKIHVKSQLELKIIEEHRKANEILSAKIKDLWNKKEQDKRLNNDILIDLEEKQNILYVRLIAHQDTYENYGQMTEGLYTEVSMLRSRVREERGEETEIQGSSIIFTQINEE